MRKGKELNINFKEGFGKLREIEEKYDLFSFVCEGIPLWLYGRDRALNILSGITSYSGQTISTHRINPFNLIGRIFSFFWNFFKLFNSDIIIFTNERHLEKESSIGKYYNPFAEIVLDTKKEAEKILIFEFPIPMTSKYRNIKYNRYLPIDVLLCFRQISYPFFVLFYRKSNKEFEPKLKASGLFNESEVKEILRRCHWSVHSIKCFSLFLRLVKLVNPKARTIYSCMGGFDKFPGVVEIQTALILDFQSVYIYPQTPQIKDYLRDKKMIVLSNQTRDLLVRNGYPENNFSVIDNPKIKYYFLRNVNEEFFEKNNAGNKIVIVGNWGGSLQKIMKKVISDIEQNKENFKDWDISLVLHPTEENTYKDMNLQKIKVYENHEVSLWEKLSLATCTIDISSTVIKESSYFGCFNIIMRDEKFDSQLDFIEALCGDYPFKEIITPENFVNWFSNNSKMLKNHNLTKKEILKDNYKYFKNNINKN